MCDDFIHQGLTHDPTVSRRAFGLGAAATVVLSSAAAAAQAKVVEKDVNVTMETGFPTRRFSILRARGIGRRCWCGPTFWG